MNLAQFLSNKNHYFNIDNDSVLVFKGTEYPLLFFSNLFRSLKNSQFQVQTVDCSGKTFASLCAQFETTFLGQRIIYWLGNSTELDHRIQKKLITYLGQYKGPHKLVAYIPTTMVVSDLIPQVVIEKYTSFAVLEQLGLLFYTELTTDISTFITALYSKSSALSLDKACLLLNYNYSMGIKNKSFLNEWLDLITLPETSLFTLSQYFFAQNKKAFFKQWSLIEHNYSDAFWLTFWSEQLWRASGVITLLNQKKMVQVKKMAFRLPFSFVKTDWKLYSSLELAKAHSFIYLLDYRIKNGGDSVFLHLFYTKFLSRDFQ